MNEQINILLEVLEEIKQQNRELKASITNLVLFLKKVHSWGGVTEMVHGLFLLVL